VVRVGKRGEPCWSGGEVCVFPRNPHRSFAGERDQKSGGKGQFGAYERGVLPVLRKGEGGRKGRGGQRVIGGRGLYQVPSAGGDHCPFRRNGGVPGKNQRFWRKKVFIKEENPSGGKEHLFSEFKKNVQPVEGGER